MAVTHLTGPPFAGRGRFWLVCAGIGRLAQGLERLVHTEEVTGSIPVSPTTALGPGLRSPGPNAVPGCRALAGPLVESSAPHGALESPGPLATAQRFPRRPHASPGGLQVLCRRRDVVGDSRVALRPSVCTGVRAARRGFKAQAGGRDPVLKGKTPARWLNPRPEGHDGDLSGDGPPGFVSESRTPAVIQDQAPQAARAGSGGTSGARRHRAPAMHSSPATRPGLSILRPWARDEVKAAKAIVGIPTILNGAPQASLADGSRIDTHPHQKAHPRSQAPASPPLRSQRRAPSAMVPGEPASSTTASPLTTTPSPKVQSPRTVSVRAPRIEGTPAGNRASKSWIFL